MSVPPDGLVGKVPGRCDVSEVRLRLPLVKLERHHREMPFLTQEIDVDGHPTIARGAALVGARPLVVDRRDVASGVDLDADRVHVLELANRTEYFHLISPRFTPRSRAAARAPRRSGSRCPVRRGSCLGSPSR